MRVVAGEFKSRRLARPPAGVRPTSDRVRESVFARLGNLEDARVLDLYAGTGALGIEALSRGASWAVFIERAPRALAVVHANLESLGLSERARVEKGDAAACVARLGRAGERFDLVFVDPPYASGEVGHALLAVAASGVLAEGGAVVVETARRDAPDAVAGLRPVEAWRYGDTLVTRMEP